MTADVITLGEAMVRLTPPGFGRLELARQFDVQVGGAELNVAVALSRLGRSAAWVSRLPDAPLGRLALNRAREAGVNVDYVLRTEGDRVGLFFVELGASPRPSAVHYDRRGSAMASLKPGMLPWEPIFAKARWFHVSGITLALGPEVAAAVREAIEYARLSHMTISLDVNYRSKLWSVSEASRCLRELCTLVDVLIASPGDANQLFDVSAGTPENTARQLAHRYKIETVAMTLRDDPLAWRNRVSAFAVQGDKSVVSREYEVEIVDRIGAGDAFTAGLIHGLLDGDLQKAVDWGAALAALKHTIPGDFAWVSAAEVEAAIRGDSVRVAR